MSSSTSNVKVKQQRFTIDDAFEEETDEAIRICTAPPLTTTTTKGAVASTTTANELLSMGGGGSGIASAAAAAPTAGDTSRDSDSLIQYSGGDGDSSLGAATTPTRGGGGGGVGSCLRHPKVRENWRMVLAAATLLLVGVGLLAVGLAQLVWMTMTGGGLQAAVFLLAGLICFVPGAYHVVYICLAARGWRGYQFHNLPLFS